MLDFHAGRAARRELSGGDRAIASQPLVQWSWSSRTQPTPAMRSRRSSRSPAATRCRLSRSASKTSSRAMHSPTNCRHVSGSTRSKAGTSRSTRWLAGSVRLQAPGRWPPRLPHPLPAGRHFPPRRGMAIAAAGLLSLVAAAGAWWALRPPEAAAHSMTVRLTGFQLLSADLPATLPDTVDAEITAAFSVDGVVGVSTAPAPGAGRSAGLHTGRDDPAGRRHDPSHHSHGQRALRRNLVV